MLLFTSLQVLKLALLISLLVSGWTLPHVSHTLGQTKGLCICG